MQNCRDWSNIAKLLKNRRTGKQCRQRYNYHLQHDFKTGGWSREEDRMIVDEQESCSFRLLSVYWLRTELFVRQARLGNSWSRIARLLPGRSGNAVKNRWYSALVQRLVRKSAVSLNPLDKLVNAPSEASKIVSLSCSPEPGKISSKWTSFGNLCTDSPSSCDSAGGPTDFSDRPSLTSEDGAGPFIEDCTYEPFAGPEDDSVLGHSDHEDCGNFCDALPGSVDALVTAELEAHPGKDSVGSIEVRALMPRDRKRMREHGIRPNDCAAAAKMEEEQTSSSGADNFWNAAADHSRSSRPRRNSGRGVSRVESPESPGRHARHRWLLRRLFFPDETALPPAPASVSAAEHRDSTDMKQTCESERDGRIGAPAVGAIAVSSTAQSAWATSIEDPAGWVSWPSEEGWLGEGPGGATSTEDARPGVEAAEQAEVSLADADLLLSCPAQYLVPLPEERP